MYDIYNLLGVNKNSSLKIYEENDNLIDIFTNMVANDYSQIVYLKNGNFYLMTELSIIPIVDDFAKKASKSLSLKTPTLTAAMRFDDVILEVIDYKDSPEDCIKKLRRAIKVNLDKYASIMVRINGSYYYFNYSDLDILNKISV